MYNEVQGLLEVRSSAILDTVGSNQSLLCPMDGYVIILKVVLYSLPFYSVGPPSFFLELNTPLYIHQIFKINSSVYRQIISMSWLLSM